VRSFRSCPAFPRRRTSNVIAKAVLPVRQREGGHGRIAQSCLHIHDPRLLVLIHPRLLADTPDNVYFASTLTELLRVLPLQAGLDIASVSVAGRARCRLGGPNRAVSDSHSWKSSYHGHLLSAHVHGAEGPLREQIGEVTP
jgi:hypothetical protein